MPGPAPLRAERHRHFTRVRRLAEPLRKRVTQVPTPSLKLRMSLNSLLLLSVCVVAVIVDKCILWQLVTRFEIAKRGYAHELDRFGVLIDRLGAAPPAGVDGCRWRQCVSSLLDEPLDHPLREVCGGNDSDLVGVTTARTDSLRKINVYLELQLSNAPPGLKSLTYIRDRIVRDYEVARWTERIGRSRENPTNCKSEFEKCVREMNNAR